MLQSCYNLKYPCLIFRNKRISYYICNRNVTNISTNTINYGYKSISCDFFSDPRFSGIAHLWYEGDEWGFAEDGRISVAPHFRSDDNQPVYGNAYRYLYYLCRSEFLCNHRHDGFLCECGFAHLGSGHFRDYGCQHRYHLYGMDYVAGL